MDFGQLPPEINSGRMYTGPGPGPMLAAAAAWEDLGGELHSMAAAYESAVAELAVHWRGPSAQTMAAAAAPYTAWLHTTAAQAEEAAAQARTAAAAYEAAFAATVPPPMIAANRSLLATLVATNILGQNTLAIAATEAHYTQMWAQDAMAMYGYAASSALATRLTAFKHPPETTDPADTVGGPVAVARAAASPASSNLRTELSQLISAVPNTLHNLGTSSPLAGVPAAEATSPVHSILKGITSIMAKLTGPYSPLGHIGIAGGWWLAFGQILGLAQNPPGVASLLSAPKPITGALAPLLGHLTSAAAPGPAGLGSGVGAAMSRAGLIGGLSVPQAWGAATPAIKAVATGVPAAGPSTVPAIATESQAGLFGGTAALSSLAGRAMDAGAARSVAGAATRTIGTAAACLNPATAEELDNTVTILVIPAADQ